MEESNEPFFGNESSAADDPQAAIEVKGNYYLLCELLPSLQGVSTRSLFATWDQSLPLSPEQADRVYQGDKDIRGIPPSAAHLLAPILYPDKLLAVVGNYSSHQREMGMKPEKGASVAFFLRPPTTTLVGPGNTVRIPTNTNEFDWQCEVAAVVGRTLSHASRAEAAAAIAGYAIGLDLSCRDLIYTDNELKIDLVRGKAQDTMGPCGPTIVPAMFVPDVNNLRIELWVNEEKMMDASTSEMLYKIDEQLSIISEFMTLAPGDSLFTGSPSGSAAVHGNCWSKPWRSDSSLDRTDRSLRGGYSDYASSEGGRRVDLGTGKGKSSLSRGSDPPTNIFNVSAVLKE